MKKALGRTAYRVARKARRLPRQAFLEVARRAVPAFGIGHDAGVILVPSDDLTIRPKLFVDGARGEFQELERTIALLGEEGLAPSGTFVDVGANLGTTSLAALALHGFEHVVAVEPDPENARYLRATAALNGVHDRLAVVEAAADERPGRATFVLGRTRPDGRVSGTGSLLPAAPNGRDAVDVRVVSLDELVSEGAIDPAAVGLLWLDVQGHEGFVLRGATKLLERPVPVVTALRRRRLESVEGREALVAVVREHWSRFVDLRGHPWSPSARPVDELDDRIENGRSTDVLLLP